MRVAIILFLVFICGSVSAKNGMYINCSNSPKEAVLTLPKPASDFGRVSCTKYGHIIQPVENWIWTRPGGYSPVFYPAQMVSRKPKVTNNSSFFKSISVRELASAESKAKWSYIGAAFDSDRNLEIRGMEISAKNSKGGLHKIYIFNNGWGYGCSPKCNKEGAFILLNKDRKAVSW